jgi:hypothetical protein
MQSYCALRKCFINYHCQLPSGRCEKFLEVIEGKCEKPKSEYLLSQFKSRTLPTLGLQNVRSRLFILKFVGKDISRYVRRKQDRKKTSSKSTYEALTYHLARVEVTFTQQ